MGVFNRNWLRPKRIHVVINGPFIALPSKANQVHNEFVRAVIGLGDESGC